MTWYKHTNLVKVITRQHAENNCGTGYKSYRELLTSGVIFPVKK